MGGDVGSDSPGRLIKFPSSNCQTDKIALGWGEEQQAGNGEAHRRDFAETSPRHPLGQFEIVAPVLVGRGRFVIPAPSQGCAVATLRLQTECYASCHSVLDTESRVEPPLLKTFSHAGR